MDFIVLLTESLEKDIMEGKPEDKLAEHPLINNITLVIRDYNKDFVRSQAKDVNVDKDTAVL